MARVKNFTRRGGYSGATEDGVIAIADSYRQPGQAVAVDVPIDRILPNPFQARRSFDGIEELASAIRTQGFVTRLRVRPSSEAPGYFELVYGERRLRAGLEAGLTVLPCDTCDYSDTEMLEIGLMENVQREDLHPLEEAETFQTLIERGAYTIRSLAERIGKDKSYVEERLVLLNVPPDVQQMLEQRPDAPLRVAREIAKLPTSAARQPLIAGVVTGTLTRDEVVTQVRQHTTASGAITSALRVSAASSDERPHERPLDRSVERDIASLDVILARWRQATPRLSDTQKQRLLAYLNGCRLELDDLTEQLRG